MMGQSKHIVVVDDNRDVRDVIVDTLQEHNHRVSAATGRFCDARFSGTGDKLARRRICLQGLKLLF
jgi:CheY-like chemotaxis protein